MTSIFLTTPIKSFPNNFEIARNFFFQPQIEFCTEKKTFTKKFLHGKFNFLCVYRSTGSTKMGSLTFLWIKTQTS